MGKYFATKEKKNALKIPGSNSRVICVSLQCSVGLLLKGYVQQITITTTTDILSEL